MPINVLIVAGERFHRKILVNLLGQLDYSEFEILEAENGKDAVAQLSSKPQLELILLDARLEDTGAAQFLTAVRRLEAYAVTSVVILCDEGDPILKELSTHNIQAVLTKPFDPAQTRKNLSRVIYTVALRCGIRRTDRKSLLLIDNDASFVGKVEPLLDAVYSLESATNLEQGVSHAFLNRQLDVVLLSSRLEEGWEAGVRRLREQLRLPPPVILLLGNPGGNNGMKQLADGVTERGTSMEDFIWSLVNNMYANEAERQQVLLEIVKRDLVNRFRAYIMERVQTYLPDNMPFSYRRNLRFATDWQAIIRFENRDSTMRLVLSLSGIDDELISMVHNIQRTNNLQEKRPDTRGYLLKLLEPIGDFVESQVDRWKLGLYRSSVESSSALSNRISYEWAAQFGFESDTTNHRFQLSLGLVGDKHHSEWV